MNNLPHILTAKDIQNFLNISKSKAYELFQEKEFPTIQIGGSKRVFRDDFLTWVDNHKSSLGGN